MFKSLQVLRTSVATQSVSGVTLPVNTRVVVVSYKTSTSTETIVARVQDPEQPEIAKLRVILTPEQVDTTKRGRPTVNS